MPQTLTRTALTLICFALAAAIGGCRSAAKAEPGVAESTEDPGFVRDEGYWVAHAVPMMTTISQDTTWSLVRRDEVDTIILRERRPRGDGSTGRLTWLISVATPPALDAPVVIDGVQAHGWLIESGDGQRTYAVALAGEVTVHERAAEKYVATINVAAAPRTRLAVREDDEPGVTLVADVDLPRRRVHIPFEDMRIRTHQRGK